MQGPTANNNSLMSRRPLAEYPQGSNNAASIMAPGRKTATPVA